MTVQELYKEFMSNPHRTPMPGKTKHETALEEAYKQYRQSYNNDMALAMMPKDIEASYLSKKELTKEITEAINVAKLLKGITQKDIKTISFSIVNSVNDIKKSMRKADAASARERGLVPQTGDWDAPGRWVTPDKATEGSTSEEQEHIDKNTPVPASVGPIEEDTNDDIFSYNEDNDPDNLDDYGESTEDDWVGMDGELKQWEFEAANNAEGLEAESSGWGGGQDHEEDDFNPETGELLVPGKNAEAVKQWAKRLGGEVGVTLVGGPTGSEPDDNIYQYHKFENGHMGGNPITPQHIADYVKFKTGKDISIPEQFRILSTDMESEVEIQSMQKHIKAITKEHIQTIAQDIVKQIIEKSTESAKAAKAKGLVPQSGDEAHPGRWVKPGNQTKDKKKKRAGKKHLKRHKHKGSTIRIQETNAPANRARK